MHTDEDKEEGIARVPISQLRRMIQFPGFPMGGTHTTQYLLEGQCLLVLCAKAHRKLAFIQWYVGLLLAYKILPIQEEIRFPFKCRNKKIRNPV